MFLLHFNPGCQGLRFESNLVSSAFNDNSFRKTTAGHGIRNCEVYLFKIHFPSNSAGHCKYVYGIPLCHFKADSLQQKASAFYNYLTPW